VADIVRAHCDRIAFAHIRNVKHFENGDFSEASHRDCDGDTGILDILRAYHDCGYEGYIRPDHGLIQKFLTKMANSINLANLGANDIVAINNDVYSGAIKAVAGKIAAGNVTFEIDGKQVNLSDAGCSYLNTNLEPINRAKAEEKPAEVLLLLAAKSTNLIAPSESTNATIKSGALATSFAKGSKELDLAKLSDSDLIRFNHLGKTGEVNVLEVKPGAATIQVDGDVIELGDAAASYIDNNYKEIKMAAAEEDPKKVLFALKAGTTKLVSASLVSNQKIAKGAVDTVFVI
jgi:hypothetical protein